MRTLWSETFLIRFMLRKVRKKKNNNIELNEKSQVIMRNLNSIQTHCTWLFHESKEILKRKRGEKTCFKIINQRKLYFNISFRFENCIQHQWIFMTGNNNSLEQTIFNVPCSLFIVFTAVWESYKRRYGTISKLCWRRKKSKC